MGLGLHCFLMLVHTTQPLGNPERVAHRRGVPQLHIPEASRPRTRDLLRSIDLTVALAPCPLSLSAPCPCVSVSQVPLSNLSSLTHSHTHKVTHILIHTYIVTHVHKLKHQPSSPPLLLSFPLPPSPPPTMGFHCPPPPPLPSLSHFPLSPQLGLRECLLSCTISCSLLPSCSLSSRTWYGGGGTLSLCSYL